MDSSLSLPIVRDPLDAEIGRRIRAARRGRGLSRKALGDELGISCQQVVKYEGGASRISASTLYAIARVVDLPLAAFFSDEVESATEKAVAETWEDVALFAHLPPAVRQAVLGLARDLTPRPPTR